MIFRKRKQNKQSMENNNRAMPIVFETKRNQKLGEKTQVNLKSTTDKKE